MDNSIITAIGILIIFIATTAGAGVVFFFKGEISERLSAAFLGFAGGIMTAASVWSLLIPSIDGAKSMGALSFLPACVGFILGGIFVVILGKTVKPFSGLSDNSTEIKKQLKLFIAITVHNIPEGLAVGFAFGGAAAIGDRGAFLTALTLAVGIAVQNFPEGAAVSLPMKNALKSNGKAFLFGMGSGLVEPIAALIGLFLAGSLSVVQPWLLSFSAGAMIFVVVSDLIPDGNEKNKNICTWGYIAGFVLMMALDVALG